MAMMVMLGAATSTTGSGTMEDMEHIVIFMQENRAFDHYYGVHSGVRGFNDPAAPELPNGRPIWYQPTQSSGNATSLCGCGACVAAWSSWGVLVERELMGMQCPALVTDFGLNTEPAITIQDGQSCTSLFQRMMKATYRGKAFADLFDSWSCDATLVVNEVNELDAAGEQEQRGVHVNANTTADYMLPFPLQFNTTSTQCMPAPAMGYDPDIPMFNGGLMDAWNTARAPGMGMAHFNRGDLPYYYALMDNFLVGDQYFQSTFTATNPNRLHLFSGSNGLSVPGSGADALSDFEPLQGFSWETMAETLEGANVTWKLLQEKNNFDDNGFAWFTTFKEAKPGQPLYDNGLAIVDSIVTAFGAMVANDSLPQVTWIVAPSWQSEHATNHPGDGEALSNQLLNVLADPANAAVYAKTAFILNYDEGGQFFDHHWPPTPPVSASHGASTVTTVGELTLKEQFGIPAGNPIGLGFRVPMMIISPWTRGAITYSQVSDHTSVIQLIERRFGVRCPNISPWRRAVTSDLTNAFDWASPDYSWPANLPSTADNVNQSNAECADLPPPQVPVQQHVPTQEPGTRTARALPYSFDITDSVAANGTVTLRMANVGQAAAVLYVFNGMAPMGPPRKYTIGAGLAINASWAPLAGKYDLRLHGPNGFVRRFQGDGNPRSGSAQLASTLSAHLSTELRHARRGVVVLHTDGPADCQFIVRNTAADTPADTPAAEPVVLSARGGEYSHDVQARGNWYDLTVEAAPTGRCAGVRFVRRFMGHAETGKDSITDPAMALHRPDTVRHPPLPDHIRVQPRWNPERECQTARQRLKDACWGYGSESNMHHAEL